MKKMILVIYAIISYSSFAQINQWQNFNTQNSRLPSNNIYAIAKDQQGFVWIGTNGNGLIRFDGRDWITYDVKNSGLQCNFIRSIAVDAQGNKWIGTYCSGLYKFDGIKWTQYDKFNSPIPTYWISSIAIDKQGVKWIGCGDGGLLSFDDKNWKLYTSSNSYLPVDAVYSIAIDTLGNKWIGTNGGGLAKFDGTNWTVYNRKNSNIGCNAICAVTVDSRNVKWIGTYLAGLVKFDGRYFIHYNKADSVMTDNWVHSVAIDPKGVVWGGMDSTGLVKLEGTVQKLFTRSNSPLADNYIRSLMIDEFGNKWIGTYSNGISVYNENGVKITGLITLSSPSTGNTWAVGARQTINWFSSSSSQQINIKLSVDSGTTYPVTLVAGTFNDGIENVTVPDYQSPHCRIKVESVSEPSVTGYSPGTFSIIRLNSPDSLMVTILNRKAIRLDWKDNSDTEAGFIIQRRQGTGTAFAVIDSTYKNTVSYIDTAITSYGSYQYRVKAYYNEAQSGYTNVAMATVTGIDVPGQFPSVFTLYQNYPNPFNPLTRIKYSLPVQSDVELIIFNIKGAIVKTFVSKAQPAGDHTQLWDGKDSYQKQSASGTYFYKLTAHATDGNIYERTGKMILIK